MLTFPQESNILNQIIYQYPSQTIAIEMNENNNTCFLGIMDILVKHGHDISYSELVELVHDCSYSFD